MNNGISIQKNFKLWVNEKIENSNYSDVDKQNSIPKNTGKITTESRPTKKIQKLINGTKKVHSSRIGLIQMGRNVVNRKENDQFAEKKIKKVTNNEFQMYGKYRIESNYYKNKKVSEKIHENLIEGLKDKNYRYYKTEIFIKPLIKNLSKISKSNYISEKKFTDHRDIGVLEESKVKKNQKNYKILPKASSNKNNGRSGLIEYFIMPNTESVMYKSVKIDNQREKTNRSKNKANVYYQAKLEKITHSPVDNKNGKSKAYMRNIDTSKRVPEIPKQIVKAISNYEKQNQIGNVHSIESSLENKQKNIIKYKPLDSNRYGL
ncbi:hypothetical protein AYI70_g85 [Smittium culicis]|uniref:Uncharacterized protein n=1 Tax=Smittium culicis TaxID=133412 RepID=A0A1R1YHX4_9FUNG|nr:hypothetical protein AYI70_g85 [Smittium culicis]